MQYDKLKRLHDLPTFIRKYPVASFAFLVALSVVMHWHVFPLDLIGEHNIRQAQTQQNILNFHRYDFNILNPRLNIWEKGEASPVFRYEFPIMQWTVALVFKLTGESFMVTRILMFLLGITTLAGFYKLASLLFNDKFLGMIGAWAFNFSPAFYYYTTCPFPDNLALSSAIWSLALFFQFRKSDAKRHLFLAAMLLSLAAAAKLPYIIFGAVPAAYFIQNSFKGDNKANRARLWTIAATYIVCILPTTAWYAWAMPSWGDDVTYGILRNQISYEEGIRTLLYHLTRMFPERLTNWGSVPYLVLGGYFMLKNKAWRHPAMPMLAALGTIIIAYWLFEFNMISTVHDYYMLPFLPIIFLTVTYGVKCTLAMKHWSKWLLLVFLATLPSFAINYTKRDWTLKKTWYNVDAFRYREELRAAVPDTALCILLNDSTRCVLSYLVNKRGLLTTEDNLNPEWMDGLITKRNMHYLYSNGRAIEDNPKLSPYLDTMLLQKGIVRVYRLKDGTDGR